MSRSKFGRARHFIKLTEAADRYDVSPRTIRRLIASGEITGYRVGNSRLLRVDEDEVDECLKTVPTAPFGSAAK